MNKAPSLIVKQKNVLGTTLKACCTNPMTGWFRDGYCRTDDLDLGKHVVCALITNDFLKFSKKQGNDLTTPRPPSFQGLKEGDRWCLCVERWVEAYQHGVAPDVDLEATSAAVLHYCSLDMLATKTRDSRQKESALKMVLSEPDAVQL